MNLIQKSLDLIRKYQSEEGAFYACPNFKTYQYSWFRDGSFCALALKEFGYAAEARRFFEWGGRVVLRYGNKMHRCIDTIKRGEPLVAAECFHSRFTVEGYEIAGNWGHNQLDGLGTWLWALEKCQTGEELSAEVRQAAGLVKDYLSALWATPCSDCWEEHENDLHTYTLAAVAAGLRSYATLCGDRSAEQTAATILNFIRQNCVRDGVFVKSIANADSSAAEKAVLNGVDANLLGLCTPYALVRWDDAVFQKTLKHIEAELTTPGLHRYRQDSYYGGGEWVLLTAWLGQAYAEAGERTRAMSLMQWTTAQANAEGELAEQVPHALFAADGYPLWVERWGRIASPLLWSHAQYLLLVKSLQEKEPKTA